MGGEKVFSGMLILRRGIFLQICFSLLFRLCLASLATSIANYRKISHPLRFIGKQPRLLMLLGVGFVLIFLQLGLGCFSESKLEYVVGRDIFRQYSTLLDNFRHYWTMKYEIMEL